MSAPEFSVTLVAIDDDPASLDLITAAIRQPNLKVLTAEDPAAGLALVERYRPEIALVDLMMPKMGGMEVLDRVLEVSPETDVLLITGHYSTDSAVEAIRRGAGDYLIKPVSVALLRGKIGTLIEQARARHTARELDGDLVRTHQFEGMVGRSAAMSDIFVRLRRIAPHFRTALITGATGTGKELVAAALHRLSPVGANRFAVCNCSAVVETLFESELFGHVRGAFTGASQDKPGLFEYANGGTVFLDEIGDMPLETQSKLLRVIENGEIQRVGSPVPHHVQVRIVAATNRDLREMMAAKTFREDLFYRLSMVEIHLPTLADRREDLPLLERFFLERFAAEYSKKIRGLTPRAQLLLDRYEWPGNVRELKSVLGSASMMVQGEFIDVRDLPGHLRLEAPPQPDSEALLPLEEVERRHVLRVLAQVGGNKVKAAKILGINRATIYRMLGESEPNASAAGG